MKACMQSKELHVMTEEERAKLQAHLRKMYLEIEKVCERHHLRMCAGYGTVLGAIRHKGFIPWDDDLDLLMPREDYDKLIHSYADELPKHLRIYAPNSKNGPIARFAKVVDTNTRFLGPGAKDEDSHGIFIDIFPLENSMTSIWKIKLKRIVAMSIMLIASCVQESKNPSKLYRSLMCTTKAGKRTYMIRGGLGKMFGFIPCTTWFNWLDRFFKHNKYTGFVSVPSGDRAQWKYYQPFDFELYFPAKRMPFDDIEIYVPNQPERHCEIEYGDWTWIPPVDERWQHFIKELRF